MALVNLNPAHDKAKVEFSRSVPDKMAENSGVKYHSDSCTFKISFLGRDYTVSHPDGNVESVDGGSVPLENKVCILHYLTNASGAGVMGKHISFSELPSGFIYVTPFTNRCIRPLVSIFGRDPQKLIEAGEMLGGTREKLGDYAVTVPVFSKIPVTFVLWEGDDEFPPGGNVVFDASAPEHLETEDYALLPGLAVFTMKKLAGL